jgi:hypothetical protein
MAAFRSEPDFYTTIVQALRQWVDELPNADAKCLYFSREAYSPREILRAVEERTELGETFVTMLSQLQERMTATNPKASVVDLIRRSVERRDDAAVSAAH